MSDEKGDPLHQAPPTAGAFDGSTVRTKGNLASSWSTSLDTAQLGRQYGTGMSNSNVARKATEEVSHPSLLRSHTYL